MKSKSEMIEDMMDCFDFQQVHKCMTALEWGWHTLNYRVPEEWEIRKAARKLMQSVPEVNRFEEYGTGRGGLSVRAFYENGKLVSMDLLFVVSEWSCNVKDEEEP